VLRRLSAGLEPSAAQIIVSVGDSTDDTAAIARAHGAIIVSGEKGRGNQMNAGAKIATGDYVLFLHADTTPPADVVDVIRARLRDQKTVIGGFVSLIETPTRTYWGMSYHNVIKTVYCAVISRPFAFARGFRILFGDQAMFCRRDDFEAVGGFNGALAIMEDADLCVRMHYKGRVHPQTGKWYRGRIKLLDRVITTSGRRIEPLGNFKATMIHVLIACSWNFGVSHENLKRLYEWCYQDVR
jgi:glycosyltransferase involved in cell wall biosynthesis